MYKSESVFVSFVTTGYSPTSTSGSIPSEFFSESVSTGTSLFIFYY